MNKSEGYRSERNITEYMLDNLRANGSKGDYLQLFGSLFNVIGDSLGFYGRIISMIEDEQNDRERQQQQQQIYLQEQIYITQKNQQAQLEILKDLVCELKKKDKTESNPKRNLHFFVLLIL